MDLIMMLNVISNTKYQTLVRPFTSKADKWHSVHYLHCYAVVL